MQDSERSCCAAGESAESVRRAKIASSLDGTEIGSVFLIIRRDTILSDEIHSRIRIRIPTTTLFTNAISTRSVLQSNPHLQVPQDVQRPTLEGYMFISDIFNPQVFYGDTIVLRCERVDGGSNGSLNVFVPWRHQIGRNRQTKR
jgi:hypothetical protein